MTFAAATRGRSRWFGFTFGSRHVVHLYLQCIKQTVGLCLMVLWWTTWSLLLSPPWIQSCGCVWVGTFSGWWLAQTAARRGPSRLGWGPPGCRGRAVSGRSEWAERERIHMLLSADLWCGQMLGCGLPAVLPLQKPAWSRSPWGRSPPPPRLWRPGWSEAPRENVPRRSGPVPRATDMEPTERSKLSPLFPKWDWSWMMYFTFRNNKQKVVILFKLRSLPGTSWKETSRSNELLICGHEIKTCGNWHQAGGRSHISLNHMMWALLEDGVLAPHHNLVRASHLLLMIAYIII